MNIKQSWQSARRNLLADKKRSGQVMLGFIIGIAAVYTALALGFGLFRQAEASLKQYNPDMLYVTVYMRAEAGQKFDEDDFRALLADNSDLCAAISPMVYLDFLALDLPVKINGANFKSEDVGLAGVGEDFLQVLTGLHLAEGRFLQYMDCAREQPVCVVGSRVSVQLGDSLQIKGENYLVVGVLAEAPIIDEDWNVAVFIPYTNARRLGGSGLVSYTSGDYYRTDYYINATGPENVDNLRQLIWDNLKLKYGREQITYIWNSRKIAENSRQSIQMLLMQPLFLALLVLLLSCVGIMNIMLAGVEARTREIGIRKAFGATNRDIKRQFLLESVCLSALGGLPGVLLGVLASLFACHFVHLPLNLLGLPVIPLLLTMLIVLALGVVAGSYPAGQAAKMPPVLAIARQ